MRQAGSYILSATIHAAGLALLAFAPGYSRPESAVTSGGVEAGTLFDAVAASASSSDAPPVEFEIAEPLTTDDLPTPEFVPEQTQVAQQRDESVAVAAATLPVLEVRSRVRQSPRVDRPAPSPIANAELVAAALAEQTATPASPRSVKQDTEAKPEKQDAPLTPKALSEPQPVPAPPATEKKPSTPAPLPEPAKQPAKSPVEKPAVKPQPQTSDRSISDSAEKSKSDASAPSRTGGASKTSGVDEYPRILPVNAQPEYPPAALRAGNEGRVLLAVLVSEKGQAAQVRLLTSSGFKSLDDSATAAVRSWKFQPAERAGRPTACWVKVPVNFRIDDSGR